MEPQDSTEYGRFSAEIKSTPGVQLNSYTKRTTSDDGTYVIIETHTERLERLPQPPTPEEIEEAREIRRREDRNAMIALGSIGALALGFFGLMVFLEIKLPDAPPVVIDIPVPVDE